MVFTCYSYNIYELLQ